MEIDWSVWGPPLAVLVAGLVTGVVTLGRMRFGSADPSIERDSRRIDLESTRDAAVEGLKQLELDREKMNAEEYAREREHLLSRGARALEALEGDSPGRTAALAAERTTAAAAPLRPGISPEWRGALYALGAVALIGVLWSFATEDTVERRDGASMTGNQDLGGPAEGGRSAMQDSPRFKERVAELEAKLQANPNDVAALNDLTQMFMMTNDYAKAFGYNDTALKAAPQDFDARTYRGALTAMMSMPEKALEQFDALLAEKPDHDLAIVYRAMVLFQTGQVDAALAALDEAAQKYPASEPIRAAREQARAAASRSAGQGSPPPAAAGEMLVSGTITLDPASAAALTGNETLFLSMSDPARPRPPLAAQKLSGPLVFPMPFELTTANLIAMGGTPPTVPGAFDLKVKIDLDGDAKTQEAAPSATVTGIARGTGNLAMAMSLDGAPRAAPAGGGGSSLLAPLAKPGEAAPGGAPTLPAGHPVAGRPEGGSELLASGVARLDPARVDLTGTESVFVTVRDPKGGPPLAAKKLTAAFPLSFRITDGDIIMMGAARTIPDVLDVQVRVDRDGNATTRDGEPEGVVSGVKKGSAQLELTLK